MENGALGQCSRRGPGACPNPQFRSRCVTGMRGHGGTALGGRDLPAPAVQESPTPKFDIATHCQGNTPTPKFSIIVKGTSEVRLAGLVAVRISWITAIVVCALAILIGLISGTDRGDSSQQLPGFAFSEGGDFSPQLPESALFDPAAAMVGAAAHGGSQRPGQGGSSWRHSSRVRRSASVRGVNRRTPVAGRPWSHPGRSPRGAPPEASAPSPTPVSDSPSSGPGGSSSGPGEPPAAGLAGAAAGLTAPAAGLAGAAAGLAGAAAGLTAPAAGLAGAAAGLAGAAAGLARRRRQQGDSDLDLPRSTRGPRSRRAVGVGQKHAWPLNGGLVQARWVSEIVSCGRPGGANKEVPKGARYGDLKGGNVSIVTILIIIILVLVVLYLLRRVF